MEKKILFNKRQLINLSENIENKELSTHLKPFIFNRLKDHMTSLGDNDAFPPEEDLPFDYKILKNRLFQVTDVISKIDGLDAYDEVYLANMLSKYVKECKELEKAIKPNLEKICTNVILKLFDVPNDTVDFEATLVDVVKPENNFRIKPEPSTKRNFDFDSLDDFKNANKSVLKRRMINSLIQGAAYTYATDKDLYLSELYKLDRRLIDLYERITAINDYLLFIKEEKITDENPMQGGCVEVTLGDSFRDKTIIKAQGIIFPFLLHELIRGFLELFASHGLPEDDAKARYIIKQADFIIAEPWDLRMGVGLWNYIGKEMKDTKILPYFFDLLCCLPTKEFNATLQEIFAETKKGKHMLNHLFQNAEDDVIQQAFTSKIELGNPQVSLIADNNVTFGNITESMRTDADKLIFDYDIGMLDSIHDEDEINAVLSPILDDYVAKGSARLVYDIDDYQVMKIAYGADDESEAGELQNRLERTILTDEKYKNYSIFPKFLYGSPDDRWIVVERVVPAEEKDFIYCFNMTFDDSFFLKNTDNEIDDISYDLSLYGKDKNMYSYLNKDNLSFQVFVSWAYDKGEKRSVRPWERKFVDAIKSNKLLGEIFNIASSHRLLLGDLLRISSWGVTKRNGETVIVLLDAGLNRYIFDRFYESKTYGELIFENTENEAQYELNPDEKGNKQFKYQLDYDWKAQDEQDEELSNILGLNDKKKLDTQSSLTSKSNSLFNNAKDKMLFKKELSKKLRDKFGKDTLSKDDLDNVGFDTNILRSIDKTRNSEETKVMKALENDFNVTAIGQSFSHGNAKLSADILIVNLTTATNCPSAKKGLCAVADI